MAISCHQFRGFDVRPGSCPLGRLAMLCSAQTPRIDGDWTRKPQSVKTSTPIVKEPLPKVRHEVLRSDACRLLALSCLGPPLA